MSPATGTPGTTGTIRHPDVSEISDLTEGLLPPARSAEIRRHLDDCALCADVRASLEEIRGLLGTLPGPARMPGDIAGRIDAALAAEALLDATRPRDDASEPSPRLRTTQRDVSRETSPAGHPGGSTGPGRRRARRRIAVLGSLAGAAACALGLFLFVDFSSTPHPHSAASDAAAHPSVGAPSGAYTAQGLQSSVQRLIAPEATAETDPGTQNNTLGMEESPSVPGAAPGDRRVASDVPACVQEATGRSETPLASERGRFQGTAVHLLVLPHPGDDARVDAYLVDTTCESTDSATPGKVLLKNTFPRS